MCVRDPRKACSHAPPARANAFRCVASRRWRRSAERWWRRALKLANGTARLHPKPPLPQRICWANHTLNIVPHTLVHGRRESNHIGKAARVPRATRVNTVSATTARPPALHTPSPPTQHTAHGQRELDIWANFVKMKKTHHHQTNTHTPRPPAHLDVHDDL
jgi:hypothetical protein